MKKIISFKNSLLLLIPFLALGVAAGTPQIKSDLFILEEEGLVSVSRLARNGELEYSVDRDTRFCFKGDAEKVAEKIRKWHEEELFYPGGGGGHVLEDLKVTSGGVVGPKINMTIVDEVTGEVEPTIYIIKCR